MQEHTVKTTDGFELKVMRIKAKSMVWGSGKPVFLQHGLFSSAETWVINKEKSAAFKMAHAGFDVWLGNNRGNRYSRKNDHLDPTKDDAEFFDYSFYELGKYDLPAQIDYVLKTTGQSKLAYMGHSQGTSQMFSALSEGHGNLKDKVSIFIACAPIVNLKNSPNKMI